MTGRERKRRLSAEERVLWSTVARTVKPLRLEGGKVASSEPDLSPPAPPSLSSQSPQDLPPFRPPPQSYSKSPSIDRPTIQKLAKGKLVIDATIDLHNMNQVEAHDRLLGFLHRASAAGFRHVLVITGKGSSGNGVLRRAVPEWLSTPPFAGFVSGYGIAARHHGGAGAIYIRLKRVRSRT